MSPSPPDGGDWREVWRPMLDAVGTDIGDGRLLRGADPVEAGSVRRYLEPLELDCALHYDRDTARAFGYDDIVAPYTSVLTYTIPAMWEPGQVLFTSDRPSAQPASSPINGDELRIAPQITGFFATEIEMDFVRPAVVGERLARRGSRLLACTPKWISVGRGAFLTLEAEVVTDPGEVIGHVRTTVFAYEPVGPDPSRSAPATGAPAAGARA